jgi:hypothetical protein
MMLSETKAKPFSVVKATGPSALPKAAFPEKSYPI